MSLAAAIMTPLALSLPAPGAAELPASRPIDAVSVADDERLEERPANAVPERPANDEFTGWTLQFQIVQYEPEPAQQVRIEQRMTIRIIPRNDATQQMTFSELPDRAIGPRFVERKIGDCVKASRITGVQTDVGNRLLLFMSDRKIVSAMLERACRSRDFYSGFYLSKNKDGKLCIARDTLQSRSGANCKLTQLRELVEVGD